MTRRRIWAIAAGVAVAALVAWAIVPPSEKPFRAYVEELRAAGEPTTIRELLGPDPPDAENAAVEILAALDELTRRVGPESAWPEIGPWGNRPSEEETPERFAELSAFLTDFGPFLDRLAAALNRPRCRFKLTGPAGFEDRDGTLTTQKVARILSGMALVLAPERIDTARTMLRLARRNEPTHGIDWFVDAALARSAAETLRRAVEGGEIDVATVRARVDDLLVGDWTAKGPAVFMMSRTHEVSMCATWLSDGVPAGYPTKVDLGPIRLSAKKPDPEAVVEDCRLLEEAARLPTTPTSAFFRAATALGERASASKLPIGSNPRSTAKALVRTDAQTRLAGVGLAVAERKAKTGAFPASLDELKDAFPAGVPRDPYTDAPFVYERTDAGVRISSLGRLPEDPAPEEDKRRGEGLVWELKR